MDAHVGQVAGEQERLDPQAPQQDVEVGVDEAGVAALLDEVVARSGPQLVDQVGAGVTLQAVDALGAVQLTTEVDEVPAVDLLEEDHRDAGAPARPGDAHDPIDAVPVPGHVGDAGDLEGLEAALLHVDDDEGRPAGDQLPHASSSYPAP